MAEAHGGGCGTGVLTLARRQGQGEARAPRLARRGQGRGRHAAAKPSHVSRLIQSTCRKRHSKGAVHGLEPGDASARSLVRSLLHGIRLRQHADHQVSDTNGDFSSAVAQSSELLVRVASTPPWHRRPAPSGPQRRNPAPEVADPMASHCWRNGMALKPSAASPIRRRASLPTCPCQVRAPVLAPRLLRVVSAARCKAARGASRSGASRASRSRASRASKAARGASRSSLR